MAGDYLLEARLLDEAQLEWVERFDAGDDWWAREVTDFLLNDALWMARDGLTQTILFSLPGAKEIVGFVSAASASLSIAEVEDLANLPPDSPRRIPSVLIPYMEVARDHQGRPEHFGREIHTQLLESLSAAWPATRLMYLECWEENVAGLAFWHGLGYTAFKIRDTQRPDGDKARLLSLFHDRFVV